VCPEPGLVVKKHAPVVARNYSGSPAFRSPSKKCLSFVQRDKRARSPGNAGDTEAQNVGHLCTGASQPDDDSGKLNRLSASTTVLTEFDLAASATLSHKVRLGSLMHVDNKSRPRKALCSITLASKWIVVLAES
jgi:hypothetical protein